MPHFHLSLQSGDDLILKRMKRRHGRDDAIAFCRQVRALRPGAVFGADLIAGFPTETAAMFDRTLAIVGECELAYLHVFPFSPRPGTPAARMPQLDRATVKDRAARLRSCGDRARAAYESGLVGTRQRVLVEKPGFGRTETFAGVALDRGAPGSIVTAEIRAAGADGLVGQTLSEAS